MNQAVPLNKATVGPLDSRRPSLQSQLQMDGNNGGVPAWAIRGQASTAIADENNLEARSRNLALGGSTGTCGYSMDRSQPDTTQLWTTTQMVAFVAMLHVFP